MAIQIALLIKGNINSDGGMQPLVSIGVFPKEVAENMDTDSAVQERLSYKLRHGAEYIAYTVSDTLVRSAGSSRGGRLVVGIAIPRVLKLADNKSPYTLLKAVYQKFVDESMTASSDGWHTFKNIDTDREPYIELIGGYAVEDRPNREPFMQMLEAGGTAVVCTQTEEKLAELFRDSQYPEFKRFAQIEVGLECSPTINIEIPRRRDYHVFLNGKDTGKTLSSAMDIFSSSNFLADTEYTTYKDTHVSFSLEELQMTPDYTLFDGRVRLNGDRIDCTVEAKDKTFTFTAEIKPSLGGKPLEDEDRARVKKLLEGGRVKVLFSGAEITPAFYNGDNIVISGANVKAQPTLTAETYDDYTFTIEKDKQKQLFILRVKVKEKPKAKPEPKQEPKPKPRESQGTSLPVGQGPQPYTIAISGAKGKVIDDGLEFFAVIEQSGEGKKYSMRQPLNFVKKGATGTARFLLDDSWGNNATFLGLTLQLERVKDGNVERSMPRNLYFNQHEANFQIEDFTFEPVPSKTSKIYKLIASGLVVLAIGVLGGLVAGFSLWHGDKAKGGKEGSEDLGAIIKQKDETIADQDREIKSLKMQLGLNEDSGNSGEQTEEDPATEENNQAAQQNPEPEQKVQEDVNPAPAKDYKGEIVEAVNNRNWDKLQNELLQSAYKAKAISSAQMKAIQSLYWNPAGRAYTSVERRRIDDQFQKHEKPFRNIEEVVTFYNSTIKPLFN